MKLKLTVGISLLLCAPAVAQDVYPGCEVPTTVAGRHTFFVDPVKGSDNGDGSMARPWKDLNTVFASTSKLMATKAHKTPSGSPLLATNPAAPIKGGDIIMLMSGNYGDVLLQNAFNDKFISVMAAPGQTPILQSLKAIGVSRWVFQGLTIASETSPAYKRAGDKLAIIADGWGDSTTNVILNAITFKTVDDVSGWSKQDWYTRPHFYALGIRASCVAVTNSSFTNIWNGIEDFGPASLIKGNTISNFSNDAIDLNANNVTVYGNRISDAMNNDLNTQHPDAVQTWASAVNGVTQVNRNLVIDSNVIYTPKRASGNYLQGLNVGSYYNVTIQNNVILTNHWIGIGLAGAHDSKIVNNTVMPTDPTGHPSWIMVRTSLDSVSRNVVIRNNVAFTIRAEDQSIAMDHNITTTGFTVMSNGKVTSQKQGDASNKNSVIPALDGQFRSWNPTSGSFNMHPKTGSAMDGSGAALLAPTLDANGQTRTTPPTIGAYVRQ